MIATMLASYTEQFCRNEGITVREVNSGLCDIWAIGAIAMLAEAGIVADEMVDDDLGHYWVCVDMRHYDAECTAGVDNASKLPVAVRRN